MKKEPCSVSASWAFSSPELEASSTLPSLRTTMGTWTWKGRGSGCKPLACVHPPPLHASMMPSRTVAAGESTRLRNSSTARAFPPGYRERGSACPE